MALNGVGASASSQEGVEEDRPPIDRFFEIPKTWKRLGTEEIWIDRENHSVIVGGRICLRAGPLEMFACPEHTKEHESVISVHTRSKFVHAALLAVGAKPGTPVQFDPEYKPASGPKVKITVRWKQEGKMHEKSAQEMVRDTGTGKPMAHEWVFVGSGTWKNPDTGEEVYLGDGGELVCVSNFGSATMDLPVESSSAAAGLLFEALTENIPELGTPVLLVFEPDLGARKESPPEDRSGPLSGENSAQPAGKPGK